MSFIDALKISSSGLSAERVRMNVVSENIAQANTTKDQNGKVVKRKDVVFMAENSGVKFNDLLRPAFDSELKKVKVHSIVEDQKDPKRIYDPNHPDANEDGYVLLPNISVMEELVNLINSSRAFEANSTAFGVSKSMALNSINIGKG